MEFAAIIPARYASTRFPAKPLAVLGGKPVIIRVCEQAAKVFDHVFVATDDERRFNVVKEGGFTPVRTRSDHKSGTDRCFEAFCKCGVKADVVVVDPPRKGLNADAIEALARFSPRRIVYVSCDPATLARDVALLKERGYTLKNAMAADLFPRCSHVESIVTMIREDD